MAVSPGVGLRLLWGAGAWLGRGCARGGVIVAAHRVCRAGPPVQGRGRARGSVVVSFASDAHLLVEEPREGAGAARGAEEARPGVNFPLCALLRARRVGAQGSAEGRAVPSAPAGQDRDLAVPWVRESVNWLITSGTFDQIALFVIPDALVLKRRLPASL